VGNNAKEQDYSWFFQSVNYLRDSHQFISVGTCRGGKLLLRVR